MFVKVSNADLSYKLNLMNFITILYEITKVLTQLCGCVAVEYTRQYTYKQEC